MRDKELRYLKGRKYLDALCVYFWATTPVLISILTFGTYVLLGNRLTAATVFTSMALLNMLIAPLNAFPWVLNGITEAWVSIKRIQRLVDVSFRKFLYSWNSLRRALALFYIFYAVFCRLNLILKQLPDLDLESYYEDGALIENPDAELFINGAEFNWDKPLTSKEKEKLHSNRRHTFKGKGKKMPTSPLRSETSTSANDDTGSLFYLSHISLIVKKVCWKIEL